MTCIPLPHVTVLAFAVLLGGWCGAAGVYVFVRLFLARGR